MKKIQSFLGIAAFAIAVGGAFAFSNQAVLPGYQAPVGGGSCTTASVPDNCASTGILECKIGNIKYYQVRNPSSMQCENVYYFKN